MRYVLLLLALGWALAACGGGAAEYRVTISFNTCVEQGDLEEVGALISGYDDDAEFFVQESFPPTGVARLETDVPEFCRTVRAELEGRSYIDAVSCERYGGGGDPDEPVPYP